MTEHSETPSSPIPQSEAPRVESGRMNARRRRLLRGGLSVAPAVLMLKTTPALACQCKLPSGFSVSGNLSAQQRGGLGCDKPTNLPGTWKGSTYTKTTSPKTTYAYNGTSVLTSTLFSDVKIGGVALATNNTTCLGSRTLDTCLGLGPTHPQALIVAVYLQSLVNGGTQFPPSTTVRDIWNKGVMSTGYYPNPPATVPVWDSTKSVQYLKYLTGQAPG